MYLKQSGNLAHDALLLLALKEAVVPVRQEVISQQRRVYQRLNYAAHKASVAKVDLKIIFCQVITFQSNNKTITRKHANKALCIVKT